VLFLLKLLSLGSEQQYFLQATRKPVAFFYPFLKNFLRRFYCDIMHFVVFKCYNIHTFGFSRIILSSNCVL